MVNAAYSVQTNHETLERAFKNQDSNFYFILFMHDIPASDNPASDNLTIMGRQLAKYEARRAYLMGLVQ